MKRYRSACVAVVAALIITGCATLPDMGGVAVSVAGVRPLQSTLLETSVEVTLRLTNEGAVPLALAGSAHRLHLNGTYVGRAVSNERIVVPPLGTATVSIVAFLENLTLARKAAEFSQKPLVGYRLESQFHPADGRTFGSLKTSTTGELDLSPLASQLAGYAPMAPAGP